MGVLRGAVRRRCKRADAGYEAGVSAEAKAVKALDKLETILQHSQGDNPPDFDYGFNLAYGKRHTGAHPLFAALRTVVDALTRRRMTPPQR